MGSAADKTSSNDSATSTRTNQGEHSASVGLPAQADVRALRALIDGSNRSVTIIDDQDEPMPDASGNELSSSEEEDEPLFSIPKDVPLGPCCEYHKRFQSTSLFDMPKQAYWNKYGARDSNARERNKNKKQQPWPEKGPGEKARRRRDCAIKSGLFQNPFDFRSDYLSILPSPTEIEERILKLDEQDASASACDERVARPRDVYQHSLEYRHDACARIMAELRNMNFQGKINADNDYPCLLLGTPGAPTAEDSKSGQLETNKGSWTRFVMAHFVGIANAIAIRQAIPIEVVMRASFGHCAPSAAACGESFRINVGLIPKEYQDVLAMAIMRTQEIFDVRYRVALENKKLPDTWAKLKKEYRDAYKRKTRAKKPQTLQNVDNLWKWLWSTGDADGHSVLYQITNRNQSRIEELADAAYDVMMSAGSIDGGELASDFAEELEDYPSRFHVSRDGALSFEKHNLATTRRFVAPGRRIEDKPFWEIMELMMSALGGSSAERRKFAEQGTVKGLYAALETHNIAFIKKTAPRYELDAVDGVGSDSENEGQLGEGRHKVYSKKVITATGMRAIHLAHYASSLVRGASERKVEQSNVNIFADKVYYETRTALEKFPIVENSRSKLMWRPTDRKRAPGEATKALFFDLNHCNTSQEGAQTEVDFSKFDVVVLDHTSAMPKRVHDYLNKAFDCRKLQAVFLIGSGLKNEQCGIDINPYGTIRVVTRDKDQTNILYEQIVEAEKGYGHPQASHGIRRAYKSIGAVPTTSAMLGDGWIVDSSRPSTSAALAELLSPSTADTSPKRPYADRDPETEPARKKRKYSAS